MNAKYRKALMNKLTSMIYANVRYEVERREATDSLTENDTTAIAIECVTLIGLSSAFYDDASETAFKIAESLYNDIHTDINKFMHD